MSKINNIYTGTMRTGGSLVTNLMPLRDFIVLTDIVHFFRYIIKDMINTKIKYF